MNDLDARVVRVGKNILLSEIKMMKPKEIEFKGKRFEFGKNWQNFLSTLNDDQIDRAKSSIKDMLEIDTLEGNTFVDVGSGSGLFSLAAMMLGAKRVHSFDYDPNSVACALQLKKRYFPDDPKWTIEQGSALDPEYIKSLGQFDIVYSWGVLHHTGEMWHALENVHALADDPSKLFIAIYNDQGGASGRWKKIKKLYVSSNAIGKWGIVAAIFIFWRVRSVLIRLCRFENPLPVKKCAAVKDSRGMSLFHDLIDWVGGYPFEVAKPEEIFDFFKKRGFALTQLKTCGGGHGCNEFVFKFHGKNDINIM
jgi:2-polyprenyl-6-hydroxyphenyl methylase/3-demethylubiquinone-9 3-methyltransferase